MKAFLATVIAVLSLSTHAFAAAPLLSNIMPRGGQRGSETEVTFSGTRIGDAQEVLFFEKGITFSGIEKVDDKRVKLKLKIAADCRIGEHIMHLRCAGGVTEARTFLVGPYPTIKEKEPNSEFDAPQTVPFNSTVEGVVLTEDVDYYLVEAKKGQRISAEVEGIRLGQTMFDPYVAIIDMKRFELSAADDTALLLQDTYASCIAPADGTYVVQVRESSYAGSSACRYRLHIGNFPRPRVLFPAGGKIGTDVDLKFVGDVAGDFNIKYKVPATPGTHPVYAEQGGQITTSANQFRASPFDNVMEVEPNNSSKLATTVDQVAPLAFNGIIQEDGDYDYFKFKAKKGQDFDVRCLARSLGSPLDPILYLYDGKGARISANDDSGGPDSYLRWKCPADGEYMVGVRDHLKKGGPYHVYRIEFNPRATTVSASIPEYRRYRQDRYRIEVPRGNRYASLIRVNRGNFGGDVVLAAPNLPKGMKLYADTMASNISTYVVVFEAAADAPIAGHLMPLAVSHADSSKGITGGYDQAIGLVFGQPNNTAYYGTKVDKLAVAVTEEAPFKINLVQPKVPIVRNGSMQLKVVAERKEGFTSAIALRLLFRPPGIGASGSISIPAGKNEAYYPINANSAAVVRTWKITIIGDAANHSVSTQLADLEVANPFVSMKIDMAAAEQGQSAALVCTVDQLIPFEGQARVLLHGVPSKVTPDAKEKTITKDDKEVVFTLSTDKAARTGQHKTLFCQVIITKNGESITHSVGAGGILRIDPPPPAPKIVKAAPKPKPVAKVAPKVVPKKPVVKRLTRLEMLRLEAKKRAEGESAGGETTGGE